MLIMKLLGGNLARNVPCGVRGHFLQHLLRSERANNEPACAAGTRHLNQQITVAA